LQQRRARLEAERLARFTDICRRLEEEETKKERRNSGGTE